MKYSWDVFLAVKTPTGWGLREVDEQLEFYAPCCKKIVDDHISEEFCPCRKTSVPYRARYLRAAIPMHEFKKDSGYNWRSDNLGSLISAWTGYDEGELEVDLIRS